MASERTTSATSTDCSSQATTLTPSQHASRPNNHTDSITFGTGRKAEKINLARGTTRFTITAIPAGWHIEQTVAGSTGTRERVVYMGNLSQLPDGQNCISKSGSGTCVLGKDGKWTLTES